MKSVLDVKVLRKHIDNAERQNARKCAVAQAIVESDDDIIWANVTGEHVRFARHSTERVYSYRSSKLVRDFIVAFDEKRSPQPFRLVIHEDAFVSERARQLGQRHEAEQVQRRRLVATSTGRKLRDVRPEEAPVFDSGDGFETPKLPRGKVVKPKATTAKPRPYAHRQTIAEALAKV